MSYSKNKGKGHADRKYVLRGLRLFCIGLLITAVTWVFVPQSPVLFGILHLIGVSTILSLFFLKFKKENLLIGLSVIAIGIIIEPMAFSYLFWLFPTYFSTLDYFSLMPWFGVMLLGICTGSAFYKNGRRSFKIRKEPRLFMINFIGRHSLAIYVAHIPVLIAVLYALGYSVI